MAEHDELEHVAQTLARRFGEEMPAFTDDPDAERRIELLSAYESNAAGLMRYFTARREG
jgi:hypothetical protein